MAYPAGVQIQTTAVSSTTVPISVAPPIFRQRGYNIRSRIGSTAPILIFPYQSTVPGVVPVNARELGAGENFQDNLAGELDDGISWGWAAVMETAGTATVDVVWT